MKGSLLGEGISDVSETLLITLYCRALETRSKDPVLLDSKAVEITGKLDKELSESGSRLRRDLAAGRVRKELVLYIALRARKYDEYARKFLENNPQGVIVNLGCGLDTRFFRIDDGKLILYDLDLPEVIEIKKKLLDETDRYHFIPSSVLDCSWMEALKQKHAGPFIFLAEGLFMYLPAAEVKKLVIKLHETFPGSELACEVANSVVLKTPMKQITRYKFTKELHMGKNAYYSSGLSKSDEMEEWAPRIKYIDDWSFFDEKEKKLGWMRLLGCVPLIRKVQWTVHYKLK